MWTWHISRIKDNRWTKRLMEWTPREGSRGGGRPRRRWSNIFEEDGAIYLKKDAAIFGNEKQGRGNYGGRWGRPAQRRRLHKKLRLRILRYIKYK